MQLDECVKGIIQKDEIMPPLWSTSWMHFFSGILNKKQEIAEFQVFS